MDSQSKGAWMPTRNRARPCSPHTTWDAGDQGLVGGELLADYGGEGPQHRCVVIVAMHIVAAIAESYLRRPFLTLFRAWRTDREAFTRCHHLIDTQMTTKASRLQHPCHV
jgi:hypothetical protein